MYKKDKINNIKKANILSENLYLKNKENYQYIPQNLSNEHITNVLGIQLPLNESRYISQELYQRIIEEQLIFENLFQQIADFAKEKVNAVITTVTNWKDTAALIFKILKDNTGKLLDRFIKALDRRVSDAITQIENKLKTLGILGNKVIQSIDKILTKIDSLEPVKKLFALISIGAIATYIASKITKEGAVNELIGMVQNYFSEKFFGDLLKTFLGWGAFIKFIDTITGLAKIVFDFIAPLAKAFGEAMSGPDADIKTWIFKESTHGYLNNS